MYHLPIKMRTAHRMQTRSHERQRHACRQSPCRADIWDVLHLQLPGATKRHPPMLHGVGES